MQGRQRLALAVGDIFQRHQPGRAGVARRMSCTPLARLVATSICRISQSINSRSRRGRTFSSAARHWSGGWRRACREKDCAASSHGSAAISRSSPVAAPLHPLGWTSRFSSVWRAALKSCRKRPLRCATGAARAPLNLRDIFRLVAGVADRPTLAHRRPLPKNVFSFNIGARRAFAQQRPSRLLKKYPVWL